MGLVREATARTRMAVLEMVARSQDVATRPAATPDAGPGAVNVAGCPGGEGIRPSDSTLVHTVFHRVLHYVGRQYGLQAVQHLVGVKHVGFIPFVLRPAPQAVYDVEEAAGPSLEVFLVESGGRNAHHNIHVGWLQLAGSRVGQQDRCG
jgi:hypothetical protein